MEWGLERFIGKTVTLMCINYFYTGKLIEANKSYVLLKDPKIVFETGEFTDKDWEKARALPNDWYVQIAAIESFGILK